jgi:hypothetical protein
LRDGASGLFLAASQFPRNRETRAPLVSELRPHANELDPKFRYLLEAPDADPSGRPAVIRFSRKQREHYVQSEEEGKPTGWRAVFTGSRWQVEAGPAPAEPRAGAARGGVRAASAGKAGARSGGRTSTVKAATGKAAPARKASPRRKTT